MPACARRARFNGAKPIADLKIGVFKNGRAEPAATATIPEGALKVASRPVTKHAADALQGKGIDLGEIIGYPGTPTSAAP